MVQNAVHTCAAPCVVEMMNAMAAWFVAVQRAPVQRRKHLQERMSRSCKYLQSSVKLSHICQIHVVNFVHHGIQLPTWLDNGIAAHTTSEFQSAKPEAGHIWKCSTVS